MTIGERIRSARKELGLNQTEFGKNIGLRQSSLGQIESGVRNATERIILLICEKYNVNEEWLRTGKGAMFAEINSTIIAQLADEYKLDSFEKALISGFLKLKPEQRSILKEQVKVMLREVINSDGAEEFLVDRNLKPKPKNTNQEQATPHLTVLEYPEKSEQEELEQQARKFAETAYYQFLQEKKRESQASSANESGVS